MVKQKFDSKVNIHRLHLFAAAVSLSIIAIAILGLFVWRPLNVAVTTSEYAVSNPVAIQQLTNSSLHLSQQVTLTDKVDSQGQAIAATSTVLHPGDTITVRLITANTTSGPQTFSVHQDIRDALEYGSVTESNNGVVERGLISWPAITVEAGKTVAQSYNLKVDANPSTIARSQNNIDSHDMIIELWYGDQVRVPVSSPVIKQFEATSLSLPKIPTWTGLGMSLLLGAVAVYGLLVSLQADRKQKLSAQNPVWLAELVIGWQVGSVLLLSLFWLAAAKSGFALSGSEVVVGGLLGVLFFAAARFSARAFGRRS